MKKILKEKLKELIEIKLDEDYKSTIPVQAEKMEIKDGERIENEKRSNSIGKSNFESRIKKI